MSSCAPTTIIQPSPWSRFWGVSTQSKIIFKIHKRIIRNVTGYSNRDSCWDLFKKLHLLPLHSNIYIYIYMCVCVIFAIKNIDNFLKTNSEVHGLNTRFNYDLNFPVANLSIFQKWVSYSAGVKLLNHLPLAFTSQITYLNLKRL
jgi:hypothetical protein